MVTFDSIILPSDAAPAPLPSLPTLAYELSAWGGFAEAEAWAEARRLIERNDLAAYRDAIRPRWNDAE